MVNAMKIYTPDYQGLERASELDGLLHAYFKAEMPEPWPKFKHPSRPAVIPLKRPVAWRKYVSSRMALAACIAILILAQAFLGGKLPMPSLEQHCSSPPVVAPGDGITQPRPRESIIIENDKPPSYRIDFGSRR